MAYPINKRQKTKHVASPDDAETASFASVESENSVEATGDGATDGEELSNTDEGDDPSDVTDDPEAPKIPSSKQKSTSGLDHGRAGIKHGHNSDVRASNAAHATGTFKSNVFKMQTEELLDQLRPRNGERQAAAESALHSIKSTIERLPASAPQSVPEAEQDLISNKIAVPFSGSKPPKDARYKLSYSKPENINVVGSFALRTNSRSQDQLEIDMVIKMPNSMFEDKDFLNHRYFHKRAHYLACLASGLKLAHHHEFRLDYRLFHDDTLRPILTLRPLDTSTPAAKWQINILPCVDLDQFAASKLWPDKNCVRNIISPDNKSDDKVPAPTPFYNSSLRSDMLMTAYLKLLHSASSQCSAFADVCLLGRTWLRQRGLNSSISAGGFGHFEWSALIALALQGGGPTGRPLLSSGYNSYQLLKATLQLLAVRDMKKQALSFGQDYDVPSLIHKNTPILWDGARAHNLLFKMSPWSYDMLRMEARSTLSALGDRFSDVFDAAFIWNIKSPLYRFDSLAQLMFRTVSKAGKQNFSTAQEPLVHLYDVLQRGLGNRVELISLSLPPSTPWALGSAVPKHSRGAEVIIGLAFNSENVKMTVDLGPFAEDKAAATSFREFWGEKAEMRRFKDGSIRESVVWSEPRNGCSVIEEIVRYLFERHFGLQTDESAPQFMDKFEYLIKGGTDMSVFSGIRTYHNKFENDLRELREMPLSIRHIMPADAQLSFSSIHSPADSKLHQIPRPADVVLQFEGSGRWPDDMVAIQRTKIAFLLKLEEMLRETSDELTTRIGLENESEDSMNQAFLEITYNTEATFRLRIYHDREQTLLERQLISPASGPRQKELAAIGLAKYKRDYTKLPAHTQAIARLCSRHPALSGSIRLTKKWFDSHLLSNHVSNEVIDLLVARTFTQPWPWQVPSSPDVGFLRTLFWLSRWNWRAEPLIVNLSVSESLKETDIKAIETRFEAWRKLDPALNRIAIFAASDVDMDGTTWTDGQPARVVANRMTALAKAACAEIEQHQLQLEPTSLFSSSLADFDFVLHIRKGSANLRLTPKKTEASFKNLVLDDTDTESIGFQPIRQFLDELQAVFGSAALFFYRESQQSKIAGLWNPITAARNWKVNLAYSSMPSQSPNTGVQANVNKTAMLAEIARLGGDLIERIEVNR